MGDYHLSNYFRQKIAAPWQDLTQEERRFVRIHIIAVWALVAGLIAAHVWTMAYPLDPPVQSYEARR